MPVKSPIWMAGAFVLLAAIPLGQLAYSRIMAPAPSLPIGQTSAAAETAVAPADPNRFFAQTALRHDEALVAAAKNMLLLGDDPDLKAAAKAMIEARAPEIAMLQAYLKIER